MAALKSGTRPPWVGLGAAVWVQIAAGNAYNFPLYSHTLKFVLRYNQQQLTMLVVANDIGENFGILPGVFRNKFSPWIILSIGAASCFVGYGLQGSGSASDSDSDSDPDSNSSSASLVGEGGLSLGFLGAGDESPSSTSSTSIADAAASSSILLLTLISRLDKGKGHSFPNLNG